MAKPPTTPGADLLDKATPAPEPPTPDELVNTLLDLNDAAIAQGSSVAEILIAAGKSLLGLTLTLPTD